MENCCIFCFALLITALTIWLLIASARAMKKAGPGYLMGVAGLVVGIYLLIHLLLFSLVIYAFSGDGKWGPIF